MLHNVKNMYCLRVTAESEVQGETCLRPGNQRTPDSTVHKWREQIWSCDSVGPAPLSDTGLEQLQINVFITGWVYNNKNIEIKKKLEIISSNFGHQWLQWETGVRRVEELTVVPPG